MRLKLKWMNEWICLHVSVKRKSIYARTQLLNTVHGIDRRFDWIKDVSRWCLPLKEAFEEKEERIRKFEQKFWVLLYCVYTSCGSVYKSFHLNAVHIRERVQWMAHNATNNDNDSFSNFFATSSNIFVSKFQSNCEVRLNSQFVRLPMALAATLFCPAIIAGTTDVVCIFPHYNAIALIISSVSKRISIKVLAQTQSLHMFNTCSCFFHFKLRQKKRSTLCLSLVSGCCLFCLICWYCGISLFAMLSCHLINWLKPSA